MSSPADPMDPKERLENECARTTACKPFFRELVKCTKRVNEAKSESEHTETCLEELIDLTECVDKCVAPRIFKLLK